MVTNYKMVGVGLMMGCKSISRADK